MLSLKIIVLPVVFFAALGVGACGGSGDAPAEPLTVIVPSLAPQYAYAVTPDLVYGQGEVDGGGAFRDLFLDLYIPDDVPPAGEKRFPVMLMLHGGGLDGGSRSNPRLVAAADEYARRGWLVAAMSYRLQADDPVPSARVAPLYQAVGGDTATLVNRTLVAAVDDVLSALDYLDARADSYMPWASVWGFSAGANMALISGYSLDDFGMEPLGLAAVIEIAGAINDAYRGNLFDEPRGRDPVLMIVHGEEDRSSPLSNALQLRALAEDAGLPHDYQVVPGAEHVIDVTTTYATSGETLLQRSVDYMRETVFAGHPAGPLQIN